MTTANNQGGADAGKGEEGKSTLDRLHETLGYVEARTDELAQQADELRDQALEREQSLLNDLEHTDDPPAREKLQSELDEVRRAQRLLDDQEPDASQQQDGDGDASRQRGGNGDLPAREGPPVADQPDRGELQRGPGSGDEADAQKR